MQEQYHVRLAKQSLDDLDRIREYISIDSPQNAAAMITRIFDAIDSLEMFPHRTVVERQTAGVK